MVQREHHWTPTPSAVTDVNTFKNNHIFKVSACLNPPREHFCEINEALFGYYCLVAGHRCVAAPLILEASPPPSPNQEERRLFFTVCSWLSGQPYVTPPTSSAPNTALCCGTPFASANLRHWRHACVMLLQWLALAGGSLRAVHSACQV